MQATEKIWRNGSFIPWDDAQVHVLTHALHYGTGVFEGIRAYATPKGTAVFRLTEHLERLRRSAALVRDGHRPVHGGAGRGDPRDDRIERRGLLLRAADRVPRLRRDGPVSRCNNPVDVAIAVWPWGAYLGEDALEHGVRCKVSSFRRNGPNTMPPAAKASGQYINSVLAKHRGHAQRLRRGDPAERAGLRRRRLRRERVRGARRRAVHAADQRFLPAGHHPRERHPDRAVDSATRCARRRCVRTDLYFADEVFLCGTAAEVTPIASVDDQEIGGRGPITKQHPGGVLRDRRGPRRALRRVPRLPGRDAVGPEA